MLCTSGFVDDVIFSHNAFYRVSRACILNGEPRAPNIRKTTASMQPNFALDDIKLESTHGGLCTVDKVSYLQLPSLQGVFKNDIL